jgi:HlyD family secretion protein
MTSALGRRLWLVVIAALALTAVLVFIGSKGSTARVVVADVSRENLSSVVSSNGKVEPIRPQSLRAGFPTFVDKVYVAEGQQVRRGQLLFELDNKGAQAELAQARADLAGQEESLRAAKSGGQAGQVAKAAADLQKAQALREQLRRDNESLSKLVAQKAATPQELEQNRLALAQADADAQSLQKIKESMEYQAKLDTERVALLVERSRTQVRDLEEKVASAHGTAQLNGTLYSLPVHIGDFVREGDVLAEIADLKQVRVRAFIDEPELGQIDVNQSVEIFWDAHPDRIWSGRTEVLPKQVVTHGTRNVGELLCSVSNDRLDLIPNTTVDVRIHISERPDVVVIPRGAVYIDGTKRFVFVVQDNRLHRRDIKVGIANATTIEVLSGLSAGDVVALPGEVHLKENLRIIQVRPE